MNTILKTTLAVALAAMATHAIADIVFYEHEGFSGRSFTENRQIDNFDRAGFNDRAESAIVLGERWQVCEDAGFNGNCIFLLPGRYPSLATMGMGDRISSARIVGTNTRYDVQRYAPVPDPVYDNRRRNNERLFEANVTSARAVVGKSEQRCWVEREQVSEQTRQDRVNVPGALVGALVGGVLGHQIGGGRGQDVATVGGVVAGGVIGANVGRNRYGQNQEAQFKDVQHCSNTPSQDRPEYWDVTYNFRGLQHRIQMSSEPGSTVTVNAQGEPRA
ncbi:beta/gamma crystallin-related protein [Andreprevotia chitinilytica]|uniref:beta/gamma crystallin-related protein n=1 Tax=Andreprevotia chitinilytica TaxID=396808 RepID=UPI0005553B41|nr:beta/gamma crystallin-related protein [Andreprevotia chitinilytica]